MGENANDRECTCMAFERFVADLDSSIAFDADLCLYFLVKGGHRTLVHHCHWCGGFLTDPNHPAKIRRRELTADATTFEDLRRLRQSHPELSRSEVSIESAACHCGFPDRAAADSLIPIGFNVPMHEYEICSGGRNARMRFCMECGGQLPESKRSSFFTTPSPEEMAEIKQLTAGAKTLEDYLRLLGPPDEMHESGSLGGHSWGIPPHEVHLAVKRRLDYRTRWPSLNLQICEMDDGTISETYWGNHLGAT